MENNTLDETRAGQEALTLSREDLAQLFNYPAIGELFSEGDSRRLGDFYGKLQATTANLERIIRYGTRDEAASAERAAKAVKVTLDFLKSLENMRRS